MGIIFKLHRAITRWGVVGLLYRVRATIVDRWFDFCNGTDTCGIIPLDDLTISSQNKSSGYRYEPVRVLLLQTFFARWGRHIKSETCFVDFGCGKGRALMVASEFGIARARGVEFAAELCEVARQNCKRYRARHNPATVMEVIEGDAAVYPIDQKDSLFFLFNPFDEIVLSRVLDNIAESVKRNPRDIHICLYNSVLDEVVARHGAFEPDESIEIFGYRFQIFRRRN